MDHEKSYEMGLLQNPKLPRGRHDTAGGESLIVIRRKTIYDPAIGRGKDAEREYLGRVVDGVFYSREEYHLKFQKGGVLRRVPLIPPCRRLVYPKPSKTSPTRNSRSC